MALYNGINGEGNTMELPEQRILGSLLLLSGITFLVVGLATGQLATIIEILSEILGTAIAG